MKNIIHTFQNLGIENLDTTRVIAFGLVKTDTFNFSYVDLLLHVTHYTTPFYKSGCHVLSGPIKINGK